MRLLRLTVLACSAALAGTLSVAPAQADPVGPGALDPVVGALPPAPVPYTPYDGPVCTDGDPQCIVDVIAKMEDRLAPLADSCDHDAIFSLAYLRVTQNVKAAADSGYFHDRTWLTQLDAVFADLYFHTMDTWNAGRTGEVPKAWRIALSASDDRSMTGLGDFLLNMNAHINNDFPHALATVGLTAKDGSSHKPDHNAYNQRLDSLYIPVFDEEAARFDPTFDDYDAGPARRHRRRRDHARLARDGLAARRGPRHGEDAGPEGTRRARDRGVRRRPGRDDPAAVRHDRRVRRP